ncbi:DUF262 domain-containing protein [Lentzea sp. DG1S-22]|uniref:DUF262 domain-containing protein n=1 Tax=Lentzea sp. DG1S-22 TaxID=3108822 RepID=UPI002E79D33A|nr:DUF262 domain-containing protein [Lentzea sp. DG1S-22]WVH77598.1 DUF262 domain-containing protein [Lentzea sp. DG1S-22]
MAGAFVVNRRYQRKLVWSTSEKAAFIDSLRRQLPVPLILTAERTLESQVALELIDGLQRLNAVFSFIENEYSVDGGYFDLETLAETKLRRDNGDLVQKQPALDRNECVRIANYVLPISTYRAPGEDLIEEVFRRINSNGRYLSRQEIRQAGAVSTFADLVREVSCFVRGDASVRSLIKLGNMPAISITTDEGGTGVYIEDVFWVHHRILERDQVRESRDEEIIADLLASMVLDSMPRYHSEVLDEYYGLKSGDAGDKRRERIEAAIQREDPELIKRRFEYVHGELEAILKESGKTFTKLIFKSSRQRVPRYYSTIFLALYDLLIRRDRVIEDYSKMVKSLDGIGDRVLRIASGGGTWSAENKRDNVNNVVGNLEKATVPANGKRDVLLEANESRIHRLLQAALAEHSLFELKQGLHLLDSSMKFDERSFERILHAITAIASDGPDAVGYIIVGVADDEAAAKRVRQIHNVTLMREHGFYITGIDHELLHHGGTVDGYQSFLSGKFKSSDLDPDVKSQVLRDMRPSRYNGRTVILLTVKGASSEPVTYRDKWYERQGPSTVEVPAREVGRLFSRFPTR